MLVHQFKFFYTVSFNPLAVTQPLCVMKIIRLILSVILQRVTTASLLQTWTFVSFWV